MKYLKQKLLTIALFIPLLGGCSSSDSFSLATPSNELEIGSEPILFNVNISNDSTLKKHTYSDIKWDINDDTHCKMVEYKNMNNAYDSYWSFKIDKSGSYSINAYIDDLYSSNSLTINVKRNSDDIVSNLTNVINQDGGLTLGASYDIGLNEYDKNYYSIEGADGVLEINNEGLLEVVGIDTSKLIFKKDNNVVLEKRFAVGHSILCTNVKNELIEKGIITSQSSKVTNSMFKEVTKLDLSSELQNDLDCVKGLKYLINLEEIDISDNYLSDVSWLDCCLKLKKVNLSNNRIVSLSNIEENQELEYIDASNNDISDISSIKFLTEIKYLDLSNNELKSINDVSTAYSLESLFLSNNNLDNDKFYDRLSSLENLVELGVGNCNIKFTDIKSLGYINNLKYLDISGTNPSMDNIANMKLLETLILSDCELDSKNINDLNNLTNLKKIDISNNSLNISNIESAFSNCTLNNLEYLNLGGNEFLEIPNLSNFNNLIELDLTDSYNLQHINLSFNNKIKSLILDNCNSLSSSTFNDEISKLSLEKLSIRGGFSFFSRENYEYLLSLVENNNLELRFIGDNYSNKKTVENYKSNVYFSYKELMNEFTLNENKECELSEKKGCKEIILSLANESDYSKEISINIDKSLYKLSIFGNPYKSYYIEFNILDRKTSSFTFDLYSFVCYGFTRGKAIINAENGSKVIINSCSGNNKFIGIDGTVYRKSVITGDSNDNDVRVVEEPTSIFSGYDLIINNKNGSTLTISAGNGGKGPNNGETGKGGSCGAWAGVDGGDGAAAIICHNVKLTGCNITINGGNGGNGGNTYNVITKFVNGAGGNGGDGIRYSGSYYNGTLNTYINGGTGGKQGSNGYPSTDGTNGSSIRKI